MNLLGIILTALVSLAVGLPDAPAPANSETAVLPPFFSSEIFVYACDPVKLNTINRLLKLNGKVYTKSFYECPSSDCYQLEKGATCGVLSVNISAPATSNTAVLPPFFSSEIFVYGCDPVKLNTINRLLKLNGKVYTKSFYECPSSDCYQLDNGATCSVPSFDIQTRAIAPKENKHFKCSRDRASVLVCRYGFCSTARYCNLDGHGAYCQDGCVCCKKGHRAEGVDWTLYKRESFDSSESPTSTSTDIEISVQSTERAFTQAVTTGADTQLPEQRNTTGFFMCGKNSRKVRYYTYQNTWKPSADCRPGHSLGNITTRTAYYVGQQPGNAIPDAMVHMHEISERTAKKPSVTAAAQDTGSLQACSRPGLFICNIHHDSIFICTSTLQWVLSANCRPGSCIDRPNYTAFCDAPASTPTLKVPVLTTAQQAGGNPGTLGCNFTH